jgi:hypothetical protein
MDDFPGLLATVTSDRVVAGARKMEVTRVRITEAGQRALTAAMKP